MTEEGKAILNAGLGIGTGIIQGIGQRRREKRAMKNQMALMNYQTQNQKALNEQGHELQMQAWEKTNYPAQMKMLREAGLNPSLLYGMSGGGATTTGSQGGGSASGGSAPSPQPMEIGNMLQAGMLRSQIKVNEATAEKLKADADSTRGEDGTVGASQIQSNLADALNKKQLAEVNKISAELGRATMPDQIEKLSFEVDNLIRTGDLTDAQAELVRTQTTATGVKMQLDKANIAVSEAQAEKLTNDIILGWKQLDAKLQELQIYNQGNKLRALEGKTDIQRLQQDFILGVLGKEIDLMKLNVEQQKIFVSLFNGVLNSATSIKNTDAKIDADLNPLSNKAKGSLKRN